MRPSERVRPRRLGPAMIDISKHGLDYPEPAGTDGILSKRKTIFALVILAVIFGELSVSVKFAVGAKPEVASAISGSIVTGSDNSEQGGSRATIPAEEEHGLPQKADDLARSSDCRSPIP